jgi:hypothetical protein
MNFLQICQRAAQEAGVSRSTAGPVSVLSQTGELAKIVDWVLTTYQDVQDKHTTWNFLRFDFTYPTIAATSTYLPSAVSLTELANWEQEDVRAYLTATGVSDESRLKKRTWDYLRGVRLIGTVQTGKPCEFAIRPDKSMVLWPTPGDIYTVKGEYWKRAQTMTANADEPIIPAQFHMILVWGAVRYYAGDQGAAELFALADQNYNRLMKKLEKDELPKHTLGWSLA